MSDFGEAAATIKEIEAMFYQLDEEDQEDNNLKCVILLTHAMAGRTVKEQRDQIIRGIDLDAEEEELEKKNLELRKKRNEEVEAHNKSARKLLAGRSTSKKLNKQINNATEALHEAVHCMEGFIDKEGDFPTTATKSNGAPENQNFCVFPVEVDDAFWTFQNRVWSHTDMIKDCSKEVMRMQRNSNRRILGALRKGKVSGKNKIGKTKGKKKPANSKSTKWKKAKTVNNSNKTQAPKTSTDDLQIKDEPEEKSSEPQSSTVTAEIKTETEDTSASAADHVRRSARISHRKTVKAETKEEEVEEKPEQPKAEPQPDPTPGPSTSATPKKKATNTKKAKNSPTKTTRLINKMLQNSIRSLNSMPPPTPATPRPAPVIAARKFASVTPMTIEHFKAQQQRSTPAPPPPPLLEQIAKNQAPPPPKIVPSTQGVSKAPKLNKMEKNVKKTPLKKKMMLRKHEKAPIKISSPKVPLSPPKIISTTRASQPEPPKLGKSPLVEKKNLGDPRLPLGPSQAQIKIKAPKFKTSPIGRPKTRFQSGVIAVVIPAVAVNRRPPAPGPSAGPAPGPSRAPPPLRRNRLRRSLRAISLPKRKRKPPKRFDD